MEVKMLIVGWSYTSACNLRCIHCYNASGKPRPDELNFEECRRIAKKLIDEGVDAVNFGGGECPLKEGFFSICEMLHKAKIKISLTTNGTTYKTIIPHLSLFHDIGVSLDFADEKKHDEFRGVKGCFNDAIDAIKSFVEQGVNTEVVTCITKRNSTKEESQKIYNLAKSIKVRYWRIPYLICLVKSEPSAHAEELA
ncbi:radical SAM protein [archaeon]|nr:radical SAM protein [archaeon]